MARNSEVGFIYSVWMDVFGQFVGTKGFWRKFVNIFLNTYDKIKLVVRNQFQESG